MDFYFKWNLTTFFKKYLPEIFINSFLIKVNDKMLIYSSENGNLEGMKLLLEAGADIHVWNDVPLRNASCYGHLEIVKLLLEYGADIHANDDSHLEVVKVLLEAGANSNNDEALRNALDSHRNC